jgi:hypothetical protein
MYVRIARFEGGDGDWDARIAQIGETIRNGGRGTPMEAAGDAIKRAMLLVDRESNRAANLIFCETEDDLRRADAALSQMTPASGRGARTSVEMYELALDERPGV